MGSGSSKEKTPKRSTQTSVDNKKTVNRNEKVSTIGVNNSSEIGYTSKTHTSTQVNNNIPEKSKNISQKVNGNADKRKSQKPSESGQKTNGFQSDSESETEDINEVLEATRREHEERVREQNYFNTRQTNETAYPETYAHRLQREQYKPELGIIRQKTIYRNPDEWKTENEETYNQDDFDVSKFKRANAVSKVQNVQDRDIFSPSETVKPSTRTVGPDPDNYYTPVLQKQKSVPKYDLSEEALLAEIEKEYDF